MLFLIISSAVAVGIGTVVVGLLLLYTIPANRNLAAARKVADRSKCALNEHKIGLDIILFQSSHDGNYPEDLGTLFKSSQFTATTYLCPAGGTELPSDFDTLSKDDQAKWINDHSDYVYVGKGLSGNIPDLRVVLYEKDGTNTAEGMNILFADGHAEWFNPEDAKKHLEQHQAQ